MSWKEENNKLVKNFLFKDFEEALAFINIVGKLAEKSNHHPEIHNVYNRVNLALSTHDAGNIVTKKDWDLAALIDAIEPYNAD